MIGLEELGLLKGCIYETIVSTYGADREPHAAPMGISILDGRRIVLRPYKTTRTYGNLVRYRAAVVNITSDPLLFYNSVFGGDMRYRVSHVVDAPALVEADGWLELELEGERDLSSERSELTLYVVKVELADKRPVRLYCRAVHAVIESIIHMTRIPIFLGTERNDEAIKLVEKVLDYRRLVERVAPDTIYSGLMAEMESRISVWLREYEG